MGKRPQLSQHELQVITDHLDPLIDASLNQLLSLRKAPLNHQFPNHSARLKYWKHCHAALVWAKRLAEQRTKRLNGVK